MYQMRKPTRNKKQQLKVETGFRAIHCQKCGKQERVHSNKCACQIIWHQCQVHRVDPAAHSTKKTKSKRHMGKQTGKKVKLTSSRRVAPAISEPSLQDKRDLQKRRGQHPENDELKVEGPIAEMLIRVRAKEAKRKAQFEQDENVRNMPERRADSHTSAQKLLGLLPPPTLGDQLRNKQDAESSEKELIEEDNQGQASTINTGPCLDPDAEIICADAVPDRKRYLDELRKKHQGKRARSIR